MHEHLACHRPCLLSIEIMSTISLQGTCPMLIANQPSDILNCHVMHVMACRASHGKTVIQDSTQVEQMFVVHKMSSLVSCKDL